MTHAKKQQIVEGSTSRFLAKNEDIADVCSRSCFYHSQALVTWYQKMWHLLAPLIPTLMPQAIGLNFLLDAIELLFLF